MATGKSSLDMALPLAVLLKESTKNAHDRAASPGSKLFLSGDLPKNHYIQFLMMLWHIYDTLEHALERHSAHPTLEPTYNPTLLSRAPAVSADIAHLLQVPQSAWKFHPLHLSLLSSKPLPLTTYIDRINTVADSPDPSALLAHSYVRYLGDLSGGQFVRRVVVKAYGLDEESGLGVELYSFQELGGSRKKAGQEEMKNIRTWFKEGMDKGGERSQEVKTAVITEVNLVFELNISLFTVVEAFAAEEGDVTKQDQDDNKEEEEIILKSPLKVFPRMEPKVHSLASVAALIVAACMAHFVIVVGGFTGDKGYQKFLSLERWLAPYLAG